MITQEVFENYYHALEEGQRQQCAIIVSQLLDQKVEIKQLYADLLQRAMVKIGTRWQRNEISVATEHVATTITESLLNLVYPRLFEQEKNGKKIVISCVAREQHQIGAKMVADAFELNGWDSYFVGANTPDGELLSMIQDKKPDAVGLSVSQFFNIANLRSALASIRKQFPQVHVFVGGQAFSGPGSKLLQTLEGAVYLKSVVETDEYLKRGELK